MPFRTDIEKPDGIGPEQPLVAGGDGEIRPYTILQIAHAEGQRAERLGEIENERGAELTASCADADEVESSTARPLHVREGGDGYVRGQGIENGRGPIIICRPGDDFQRRADFFRPALPRIVVGG